MGGEWCCPVVQLYCAPHSPVGEQGLEGGQSPARSPTIRLGERRGTRVTCTLNVEPRWRSSTSLLGLKLSWDPERIAA